jgi:hypothetical protein
MFERLNKSLECWTRLCVGIPRQIQQQEPGPLSERSERDPGDEDEEHPKEKTKQHQKETSLSAS